MSDSLMKSFFAHSQNSLLLHSVFLLFQDDDYTNAEALILTFSLNNFPREDPKFKVALQWEKEFLKIVQDYQKDPATNFTFAYMAEVQDPRRHCFHKSSCSKGKIRWILCLLKLKPERNSPLSVILYQTSK